MRRTLKLFGLMVGLLSLGAAAANDANPLYAGWAAQKDKPVAFARVEQMNGGVPVPGGRAPVTTHVTYTAAEVTPEAVTLKISADGVDQTLVIPAKLPANGPKDSGTEQLKIGDKTYACKVFKYDTKDPGELGRDGQGMAGQVTVWICPDVPGGMVRRQVSLTIRVTYETVDTIAVK